MEEANKLVGAGRKLLVLGKAVEAVSALQEACDLLAKKYGDTADECGEAFFWCGKALLDLARMENSVLGNALEGVPEEDEEKPKDSNVESTEGVSEKTRDELRVQVYDAMAEKENEQNVDEKQSESAEEETTKTSQAADEQKPEEMDEEKHKDGEKTMETEEKERTAVSEEETPKEDEHANEEKAGDDEEEEEGADAEMEDNVEDQGEGDATGEKDSGDEEVGNLQLAWEMLEVAKGIYERSDAKEDQLMVAQTHLSLGEVSAESGNYTQALEDFQGCLKLQLKHLESDSRLLAETHYQLGVTYSLNCQHREATEALNNSISVIKSRLEKLHGLLDKAGGPEALPDERKELEELEALLPEIQEKVEDATEVLKTTSVAAEAEKDDPVVLKDSCPVELIHHSCTCVAGAALCNHCVALLFQSAHYSELKLSVVPPVLSCTEGEQQWHKPRTLGIKPGPVDKMTVLSAKPKSGATTEGVRSTLYKGLSGDLPDLSVLRVNSTTTAPVSDISHLVRKKRKPESPVKEANVKRVKHEGPEPLTTKAHKANGGSNGHAENVEVTS